MKKIRVLIVDDEPIARRGIRLQLAGEPDLEIIAECSNGVEAIKAIEEHSPELVFLDIQMPELNGFDVVEAVGVGRMPAVIFVTAYDQHALRAFEVQALDYLLKPFDRQRFHSALERAKTYIQRKDLADVHRRLEALLKDRNVGGQYLTRLVIKSGGRIFFLSVEEVDWIESADNYVRLHTGREEHLIRETLNSLEAKLNPDEFLRIRRSAMVNIRRIKELRPLFNGEYEVILRNGTALTSSRRYRKNLRVILQE